MTEAEFKAIMLRELAGYPPMQSPDGVNTRPKLNELMERLSEEIEDDLMEFAEQSQNPSRTIFNNYVYRRKIYKLHVVIEILGGKTSACLIFSEILTRFSRGIADDYEKFAKEFREALGAVASHLDMTLPPAPKLE